MSVWVVVFVVPINAAIDPILYTFTTPKFRRLLAQLLSGGRAGGSSHHRSLSTNSKILQHHLNSRTAGTIHNNDSSLQPMLQPQLEALPARRLSDIPICTLNGISLADGPMSNGNNNHHGTLSDAAMEMEEINGLCYPDQSLSTRRNSL